MNRVVVGAVSALLLASAGFFWWQGRAELQNGAPPPEIATPKGSQPIVLPSAEAHDRGKALPTVAKKQMSPEEKRFNRFDRNRNGQIDRNEMLSTRVKAFQKLDVNHDNLLSFEEWAVKTTNRFKEIDKNGDGIITRAELDAYYAAQDEKKAARAKAKAACGCASPDAKQRHKGDDGSDDDGEPAQ